MPFCENCGNKVSETSKFCGSCGNKIVNLRQDLGKADCTEEPKITSKSRKEGKQKAIVYHRSNWVRQLFLGLLFLFLLFLSLEKTVKLTT
jgi:Predicted membrane protein